MSEDVAEAALAEEVDSSPTEASDGNLSEDAILDKYSKESREETPAEEAAPKGTEPAEASPVAEKKESPREADRYPDESLDPRQYKQVWRAHPELRRAYYDLQEYKGVFSDVKEARAIREIFPTRQDAHEALSTAEQALMLDQRFRRDPANFATTLAQADPKAFLGMASRLGDIVYRLDPGAYQSNFVDPIIKEFVSQFGQWGQRNGDEELLAALQIVQSRLGGPPAQRTLPDTDPRIQRLNEYEQRVNEYQAQATEQFYNTAGDMVKNAVGNEVWQIVSNGGSGWSDGAKKEVTQRVVDEVGQILENDSYLQSRIQYLARSGRHDDPQTRDAVANLLMGRARGILREKARERMNWMTSEILANNVQQNARPRGRREPGEGAIASNTGGRRKPTLADSKKMSADEIMEAFSD